MPQNKINLLHLVTGLGVGGAERVALDLAKNADSVKYNVSVISMSKRIEMLEEFQENDIKIEALQKDSSLKEFLQILSFLNNYVKQQKIQIIHAHMTHAMIAAVIVKMMNPKVKIVFTSHNIAFASKVKYLFIYVFKFIRNRDILFSSEQQSPIYRKDHVIIPNGVDTNAYGLGLTKYEKFTLLAVGRLEQVKNHILLLECAVELKKRNSDFQILIAGEGDQRENLEMFVKNHELADNVTLLGLRSDIAALMAKSHVFVMPSLWEGLPIVMLEAGATGLPVISTPVGTIPSLIDESTGYLANQEEFCQSMEYLYNHYDEAMETAEKLKRKVIDKYSIKSIIEKHEELYESLLNG